MAVLEQEGECLTQLSHGGLSKIQQNIRDAVNRYATYRNINAEPIKGNFSRK